MGGGNLRSAARHNGCTPAGSGVDLVRQRSANRLQELPGCEEQLAATDAPFWRSIPTSVAQAHYGAEEVAATARSDISLGSTMPWVAEEPLHPRLHPSQRPNCIPELDFAHLLELLEDEDDDGSYGEEEEYFDQQEETQFYSQY